MDLASLPLAPQILLALSAVALVVAPVLRRQPAVRRASLNRFARRVGLPVPDGLRPRVERLLGARTLATDLGAAAGFAAIAVWALLVQPVFRENGMWLLVVVGAGVTGAAVGAGVSAARQAARGPAEDGPRLARATTPTVADYVVPLELQGGRIVALLPTVLFAGIAVMGLISASIDLGEVVSLGVVAAAVLPLAALASSEVAGRRIVDQPQPATSSLELAWSDAVRARVLRDVVSVPIVVGTYAAFGLLLSTDATLRLQPDGHLMVGVVGVAIPGLIATVLVIGIATAAGRPHRYFLRRLWPGGVGTDATRGAAS